MDSCCKETIEKKKMLNECPICLQKGKSVPLITLKALVLPTAMETIDPESSYSFCTNSSCEVVYYSDRQTIVKDMIKVPVFQKDHVLSVPVCYCFGWTRERLMQAVQENQQPTDHISEQVKANRCGCEVNNPQGSCCLGNVSKFIRNLK